MMKFYLRIFTLLLSLLTLTAFADTTSTTVFSPYVDLSIDTTWNSQTHSPEPMDLTTISKTQGIQSYHLAFINDAGQCTPSWAGLNTTLVSKAWAQDLTDKMQSQGINYIIGFGGANGTDMSSACTQDQLTSVYEQVIYIYNPQGLDFDIENGTANVPKLIQSLQSVTKLHPGLKISFTLPVMPEGFLSAQKSIIKAAQSGGLNFSVNIMAMDYGSSYNGDMGQYAVQALTNCFTYLKSLYPQKSDAEVWQMLQVTAEIGVNDESNEHFTLADADVLKNFAQQKQIGAYSMWSVARDQPCSTQTATPQCSGANLQTQPYEFTQHFLN